MKKGQIPVQLLIEVVSVIVVVLVLLLGFKAFGAAKEKTREATSLLTEEKLKSNIETIALRVGSSQRSAYAVPEDVKTACFVDRSADTASLTLISEYPLIGDLLEADAESNLFLISKDDSIEALAVGPVCIPPYPYYLCMNISASRIDAILEGQGNCTIIKNSELVKGENIKNPDKYPEGAIFVASDANPEDIYRLIPVAHWKEGSSAISYPLLALHEETPRSAQDYLAPLDKGIAYGTIVFFGSLPALLAQEPSVQETSMDAYFSYWMDYGDIVIVDDEHLQSGGIKAGLYAASLNAPLIFVNPQTIARFRDKYTGRTAHIIGSMPQTMLNDIKNNALDIRSYSFSDVSDPGRNPFIQLSSTPLIDVPSFDVP